MPMWQMIPSLTLSAGVPGRAVSVLMSMTSDCKFNWWVQTKGHTIPEGVLWYSVVEGCYNAY